MTACGAVHEFFLPDSSNTAEIDYPGAQEFFEDSIDLSNLSSSDQVDTLNSICRELASYPTSILMHFSKIFCFVKVLGSPTHDTCGVIISKEARQVLGEKIPPLLREVNKMAGRLLASKQARTKDSFPDACLTLRSSIKMYCYIICNLLRSKYDVNADGTRVVSQSIITRRAGNKRPKIQTRTNNIPVDEDESGMSSIIREMCVAGLNETLASDLNLLWTNSGHAVEAPVMQLILHTAIHMLDQKNNIDGVDVGGSADSNPVATGLIFLMASLIAHHTNSYCINKLVTVEGVTTPACGGGTVGVSLDVLITPLIERILKTSNPVICSRFIIRLIATIDDAVPQNVSENAVVGDIWPYVFLGNFMSSLSNSAINDVAGDGPAAKSVAQIFEDLAKYRTSVVAIFFDAFIQPMLSCESYEVRKAAMTCLTELIIQKLSNGSVTPRVGLRALPHAVAVLLMPEGSEEEVSAGDPTSEIDNRDGDILNEASLPTHRGAAECGAGKEESIDALKHRYLRAMWVRMRDLNPFARLHCIKMWVQLTERRSTPRAFYLPLVREAVGRLSDRNHLVRRASIHLLSTCLTRGWYGSVLQSSQLQTIRDTEIANARRRYENNHAPTTEETGLAVTNENQLLSEDQTRTPSIQNDTSFDEFLSQQRQSFAEMELLVLEENSSVTCTTIETDKVKADRQAVAMVLYYDTALVFASLMCDALTKMTELLDSKTVYDVIESIAFIVTCVHNRVDNAVSSALRMLSLIYSEEMNVKAAVSKSFVDIFFNLPHAPNVSTKTMNLARVHKMIGVVAMATEGELFAMEEILECIKREQGPGLVNEKLLDALVEVIDDADAAVQPNQARPQSVFGINPSGAFEGTVSATVTSSASSIGILSQSLFPSTSALATRAINDRCAAMRLYSLLAGSFPRDIQSRKNDLLQLMDRNAGDNIFIGCIFEALSKESRVQSFFPIDDEKLPIPSDHNSHPVLRRALYHLCRPTTALGSWMFMANHIIHYFFCCVSVPSKLYGMVSNYLASMVKNSFIERNPSEDIQTLSLDRIVVNETVDQNRLGQLFFIVGQTAVKHLVAIDNSEREQMRLIDTKATMAQQNRRISGEVDDADVMHKELGIASVAHQRYELQEACIKAKSEMLESPCSIWSLYSKLIVLFLHSKLKGRDRNTNITISPTESQQLLRVAAITALTKLCVASETFCQKNLQLLFTILSDKTEHWVVKTNTIIAIGDLLCVFPNAVDPFLNLGKSGFFTLLSDLDARVRSVTVQVCTFLVLNDMMKVNDHLHSLVTLVADEDITIASNATQFIHHLALKQRKNIGNLIPPLVKRLSSTMDRGPFQYAMQVLLEKIEGDKATESLTEKLCAYFPGYVDKSNDVRRSLAHNLAFCLTRIECTSEKIMKKLTSNSCYNQYKQWLRDPIVFECFKQIAARAKKGSAPQGGERRDKAAVEEWESRLIGDASVLHPVGRIAGNVNDEELQEVEDEAKTIEKYQECSNGDTKGLTSIVCSGILSSQMNINDCDDESGEQEAKSAVTSSKATPPMNAKRKCVKIEPKSDSDETDDESEEDEVESSRKLSRTEKKSNTTSKNNNSTKSRNKTKSKKR